MIEYVKIIKHKYLENTPIELNFSTEYKYHFDEKSGVLSRDEQLFHSDFWEASNLSTIHGIVGKNGSGKTSIIREIFDWYREGRCSNFESFIFVFSNTSYFNLNKYTVFSRGLNLQETVNDWDDELRQAISIEDDKTGIESKMNIFPIFYSAGLGSDGLKYFYAPHERGESEHYVFDVSSEFLMRNDCRKIEDKSQLTTSMNMSLDFDAILRVHQIEEMRRQIEFAILFVAAEDSSIIDDIKKKIPKSVNIRLNTRRKFSSWEEVAKEFEFQSDSFLKFAQNLDEKNNETDLAVLNNLCEYLIFSKRSSSPELPRKNSAEKRFVEYWDDIPFDPEKYQFSDISKWVAPDNEKSLNACLEELIVIDRDVFFESDNYLSSLKTLLKLHQENGANFSIEVAGIGNRETLSGYLASLKTISKITTFSEVSWDYPMSSGQHALINLFSRLYYAKQTATKQREQGTIDINLNSSKNNQEHAVIFIDEIELYLHPEWQRKTIYWIENLINEVMNGIQCQVIIASHSPFVLSDLPGACVSYIGDDAISRNDNNCFAENIHTLFHNTFSMDEGLIGESARGKINALLTKMIDHGKKLKTRNKSHSINLRAPIQENTFLDSIVDMSGEFGYILDNLSDGPLKTILLRERDNLMAISRGEYFHD